MEKAIHIDPKIVVENAVEIDNLKEKGVFTVRNFANNYNDGNISASFKKLTGCLGEEIYKKTKKCLEIIKKGDVFTGYGGDKSILDPELKKEKEGNIEFMVVNKLNINGKKGESALVRMWKYGALKQLILPEGNPGNQIEWEMMLCLKDKLTIVIPNEVVAENDLLKAKDDGVKIELNPGDAIFLPLIPRQIISNNGEFNVRGTKYFNLSPAWGGENGASQKPIYWQEQIVQE